MVKLISEKRKNSSFPKKKSFVGLTPGQNEKGHTNRILRRHFIPHERKDVLVAERIVNLAAVQRFVMSKRSELKNFKLSFKLKTHRTNRIPEIQIDDTDIDLSECIIELDGLNLELKLCKLLA